MELHRGNHFYGLIHVIMYSFSVRVKRENIWIFNFWGHFVDFFPHISCRKITKFFSCRALHLYVVHQMFIEVSLFQGNCSALCAYTLILTFVAISAVSFIIFWEYSMFYQIFLSPQVKRWTIITYKHGIYELPNNLRLTILAN